MKIIDRATMNKQLLSLFLMLWVIISFSPITLAAKPLEKKTPPLQKQQFKALHQCEKKFEYDVHFMGSSVGYLHRTVNWQNTPDLDSAIVTSNGEVSFLWIDSTYHQQSSLYYSSALQHFLTPNFTQKLTGIKSREMTAEISKDGLSSTVTIDDEVHQYQSDQSPLYDLDTLGSQIRLNLLEGKKAFTLLRQASSKVKRYQFKVAGIEQLDHEKWGKLSTIKVVEVGKFNETVLWFSPQHDHQLVKAELDMIFSPHVWLTHFTIDCENN